MQSSTQSTYCHSTLSYTVYLLPLYNGREVISNGLQSHCIFLRSQSHTAIQAIFNVYLFAITMQFVFLRVKIYTSNSQMYLCFIILFCNRNIFKRLIIFFPKILNTTEVQDVRHSLSYRKQVTSYLVINKLNVTQGKEYVNSPSPPLT